MMNQFAAIDEQLTAFPNAWLIHTVMHVGRAEFQYIFSYFLLAF
jgi:hypothetical protein